MTSPTPSEPTAENNSGERNSSEAIRTLDHGVDFDSPRSDESLAPPAASSPTGSRTPQLPAPRSVTVPRRGFRPYPLATSGAPAASQLAAGPGTALLPTTPAPASSLPFFQGGSRSQFPGPLESGFRYTGGNRADFYRWLRDRLPIVSAGVWSWVHLCATPLEPRFIGPAWAKAAAANILESLLNRLDNSAGRRALDRLTEAVFLELFTLGRCAAEIVPLPDLSGVAGLRFLDPYRLQTGKDGKHYYIDENDQWVPMQPQRVFYAVLQPDPANPGGIEPLATLPFVLAIETQLLEDMAVTSHNAGAPRLQVKISPPLREPGESAEQYEQRAGSYFDDTVRGFAKLEPDDNLFTWSDVEVTVIGGDGNRQGWRIQRQEVIEDVVTGLKLFPWVLGRSHGTTKNWVQAQYNLLMGIVDSLQTRGLALAERLANTELALKGNPCRIEFVASPHSDPFALEREQAYALRVKTHLELMDRGLLTTDAVHDKLKV